MAAKDKLPTADDLTEAPSADAEDVNLPAAARDVFYNTSQSVHPRHHQPAVPAEADRVNKAASEAHKAKSADVEPTSPKEIPNPSEVQMKAGDANKQAAKLNAEGK